MTIIALGHTPDDFTGWGGTGSPVYTSLQGTWTGSAQTGTIYLVAGLPVNSSGREYGCLWLPFTQSVNTFSVRFTMSSSGAPQARGTGEPVVIHSAAMNAWLVLTTDYSLYATNYWPYYWYLTTDLADSSKYVKISPYLFNGHDTTTRTLVVDVENAGTTSARIRFYLDTTSPGGTLIGSWSGDLSDYGPFDAVSFHAPTKLNSDYLHVSSVAVSTSTLRASTMYTYMYNSDAGTYTEWSGSNAYFSTVPINYGTYGNGYYATAVGQRLTFGAEATEVSVPTGFQIYDVALTAALKGGYGTATSVAPLIVSSTDTHTGDTTTTVPDGETVTWHYASDPVTGGKWSLANLTGYEFGLIRIA